MTDYNFNVGDVVQIVMPGSVFDGKVAKVTRGEPDSLYTIPVALLDDSYDWEVTMRCANLVAIVQEKEEDMTRSSCSWIDEKTGKRCDIKPNWAIEIYGDYGDGPVIPVCTAHVGYLLVEGLWHEVKPMRDVEDGR